jgi:hypothetical protein
LLDYPDESGGRDVFQPLAEEIARQLANVASLASGTTDIAEITDLETSALDWAAHVMQQRTDESRT